MAPLHSGVQPLFPIKFLICNHILHSLNPSIQVVETPFHTMHRSPAGLGVAVVKFLIIQTFQGITGSGFISNAASRYRTAIGHSPLKMKMTIPIARSHPTEKSKYWANPLKTPRIIPFRERYNPLSLRPLPRSPGVP